ncbi:13160_t:CDS:2, partial [Ambispora leptoticha]
EKLTKQQKDMVKIMLNASDVVLSTVNNILNAVKLDEHKIILKNKTFNLLNLFESAIEIFGERAGNKQVELILSYDLDTMPKYVKSDPERLRQILINLLSNSIKYTEEGEIVMKVSSKAKGHTDAVKKIEILVELYDTGVGPDFMKNIWKGFLNIDESKTERQDGTGFGLITCKQLVEINGGKIGAESKLGRGSRFWFTWNVETMPITSVPKASNAVADIAQMLNRSINL